MSYTLIMYNYDISLLVLFSLLFFIFRAASNVIFTAFRRDVLFDGFRCAQEKTVFETENTSEATDCAKICYKNDFCYAFFFQEDLRVCIGCDGFYHVDEDLPGSQYYGRYSGKCTPGWVANRKDCYFFSSDKKTYLPAQMACKQMGGKLVEVDDNTELEYLRSMTSDSAKVTFIGRINGSDDGIWNCPRLYMDEKEFFTGTYCYDTMNYICERPRSVY